MVSEWIQEALFKRQSNYSSVVVFNTDDERRLAEFKGFLETMTKEIEQLHTKGDLTREEKGRLKTAEMWEYPKILVYDSWRGLTDLAGVDVKPAVGGGALAQAAGIKPSTRNIAAALDTADRTLRTTKSLLILTGIFKPQDTLTAALRSWAKDGTIYGRNTMIAVFVDDAGQILDQGTRDLCALVDVPISEHHERERIISRISEELGSKPNGALVDATAGLNLHQTESVLMESLIKHGKMRVDAVADLKTDMIRSSGVLVPVPVTHGFEAVGGYDLLKKYVHDAFIAPLRTKRELAKKLDMSLPRGILLYGPPGTGKTWFTIAVARELGIPFFELGTVMTKWYGESETNIKKAIQVAEAAAPDVLFIDEIDKYGQRGQTGEHEVTRRVFSEILSWLGRKERKTIVIGTTNRPQDLDEAFIRPGRFDLKIPFLYPDAAAREEILKVHLEKVRNVPHKLDAIDIEAIAERLVMANGAEVEVLVKMAQHEALRQNKEAIDHGDFRKALDNFEINREARQQELKEYLELAKDPRFTSDKRFVQALATETEKELDRVGSVLERLQE